MTAVLEEIEQPPLVIHTAPVLEMDDDQFFQFCQINRDLRIERTAEGDLVLMAPAGGSSSRRNSEITFQFELWSRVDGTGKIFDSSGGFVLPNRATRSPDVSWVRNERLDALTDEEWEKFLPVCPDFVLELRSPSDSLRVVREKMDEYMSNGARMGWLIDPIKKQVHIYRPGTPVEILENPERVSGEPVLPKFVLELQPVWDAIKRKR